MKVLLQRTSQASVSVDGKEIGSIGKGLLLFVGFGQGDDKSKLKPMAEKIVNMRVFADDKSHFNLSLKDIDGEVLVVSQFTLYADTNKGRRPDFACALEPKAASELCAEFVETLKSLGVKKVATGVFGAHMHVSLLNDGPVTIMLER